jgi:predicted lipid-binding transport protein (Tim44 family)
MTMKKLYGFAMTMMMGVCLTIGGMSDAEARRLGGGGSFGGKSSLGSSFKRPAAAPTRSMSQQKATQQNQAARQNFSKRGGLMGMLGGLAIGGLLGAMLFGGAFENINFMDILIFGGIAFLLLRLFAAKQANAMRPAYQRSDNESAKSPPAAFESPARNSEQPSGARFDSRDWFKGGANNFGTQAGRELALNNESAPMPKDFDQRAFLAGAKRAYADLQKAWDTGDLADIRGLTTDSMFGELQQRIKDNASDNRTEVLTLEAALLEAKSVGETLEAAVLFDATLVEDSETTQVREVWHFTKPKQSTKPTWFLDGIQQVED